MDTVVLRAELARIQADVYVGREPTEGHSQLANHIAARVRELEEQLPIRRKWAEIGKADARRHLAQGHARLYHIDHSFFPGTICSLSTHSQEDWERAVQELTGATILPIRPRVGDFWSLVAQVEGYNEEVWNYLKARHGADIVTRIEARASRTVAQPGLWRQTWDGAEQYIPFFAALAALLLLGRLVEFRKRREQLSTPSATLTP